MGSEMCIRDRGVFGQILQRIRNTRKFRLGAAIPWDCIVYCKGLSFKRPFLITKFCVDLIQINFANWHFVGWVVNIIFEQIKIFFVDFTH